MTQSIIKKFGYLFYLVDPGDTTFENIADLPSPNYISQVQD